METSETIQKGEKKPRKIRSPFDKEGSFKYLQRWMRRVEDKVDDLSRGQRRIEKGLGLAGQLLYNRTFLEEAVCKRDFDSAILDFLYKAGEDGTLPRDVAQGLNRQFHTRYFQPWHVRFALYRMNRHLEPISEVVAVKRGMRWALSSFTKKAWGKKREELALAEEESSSD